MRKNEHSVRVHAIGAWITTVFAATAACNSIATAETYPSRPITLVVPFAAGGPADTLGRVMAERMRTSLGHPVIVENVNGASGSIGASRVVRAAPDGYTLGYGTWGTHVINGALLPLQYDLVEDFRPVSLLTSAPLLIVTRKAMPANELRDLIAWLKASPDKAFQGTSGMGTPSHLAGVLFQKQSGTRFGFVPYRGGAAAMQDLVAGQIDLMIDPILNSLPLVRAGSIKAHAVTANRRLAAAPDILSVDEAGLPGVHVSNWTALFAPKSTPNTIIDKLEAAVVDALADPVVRGRLADLGLEIFPREQQTPKALAAFQKAEIEKWWPIVKAGGIKAQ